jgi:hypothetical protein
MGILFEGAVVGIRGGVISIRADAEMIGIGGRGILNLKSRRRSM